MADPGRRPRVLVYIPHVLAVYQPWVRQHVELLPGFDTALAGRGRAENSLDVSAVRYYCLADEPLGKAEGAALLVTGYSPRLEGFVRRFKPDLIHAHFATGATEIMDIARRLDVPLVVTYHGWDAKIPDGQRQPNRYEQVHLRRRRAMLDQAALVLTVSDWLRDEVIALGSAPGKTEVHYLGVDRAIFDGRRGTEDPQLIAMVGRLVRFKGTHFALEAFRLLRERLPHFRVEIIGAGPEQAALEQMAAKHNLPVRFLGARSHIEARDLFARARVHCFPSTVTENLQAETFGLAAAEAQAMGVPVVAAATGGIPEAVANGTTGLLVPDADPTALAAALERLLTDNALHARMSRAAQTLVADKFDVRTNLARLAGRYSSLLTELGRNQ